MSEIVSLVIDGIITTLLIVTIYYCVKLNRYIAAIRDSRSELAEVITAFDEATLRAQKSITELKASTRKTAEHLQVRIEKAEFIADDLAYILDKANKAAGRLGSQTEANAGVTSGKQSAPSSSSSAAAPASGNNGLEKIASKSVKRQAEGRDTPSTSANADSEPTQAEKALMEALKSIR